MQRVLWLMALVPLLVALACGGGARSPADVAPDLDADPLALLPSAAIVVANLDARAMFASPAAGARVAALTESVLPLGPEAGFDAKRDVDRVVLGVYATSGADVAAVVSGRFDEAKIAAATSARGGTAVVRGTYAGRATYSVGPAMYAVLSSKTVVAGTGDGVRRLLERVQDKKTVRAMPSWVVDTLSTKGADLAAAADFTTQPVAAAALGSVPLPWLSGMRAAKVIGNFAAPGMNFAATLSYADPQQASTAADGIRTADVWLKVVGPLLGGLSLQGLEVTVDGNDTKCKFALDEQALGNLLGFLPRLLPASH